MEFNNNLGIIFIVLIVVLLVLTILIDNYLEIKKRNKIKILANKEEYFVHPDVVSLLKLKDPNKGIKKNEQEYINNGKKIMDTFSFKINRVIEDIK